MAKADRKLRLGIIGLGRAFGLMRPGFMASAEIALAAAADPRPEARARFVEEFGGTAYASADEMLRAGEIDAVYIASPHQFHAAQAIAAAQAGKHVLVEKPMALTVPEAEAMAAAARSAKVKLLVGHTHSFDAPIAAARAIIERGEFGAVRLITAFNFTDFLYRPRRAEELDTARGGGVIFNQALHQIDVVRLLAGGLVETVTAQTGNWDAARPTEGAYSAWLRFPGEVAASITYSGYAHYDSDALLGWIDEGGKRKDPGSFARILGALPPGLGRAEEEELRRRRGYGVAAEPAVPPDAERWHEQFGFIVVSCERADLRPVPQGVIVDSHGERGLRPLAPPRAPRLEVIAELCDAVRNDRVPLHSGEWGLATLEAALAILQSSRERRAISLQRQIAPVARSRA
ncbi:MAG TPA: Gfo/Idh/MocA family oxidoreductase [Stellaceae bacterium]|nr:Gfo/Idh/MocA family oxidoreductase [Stellaceae bacterium]